MNPKIKQLVEEREAAFDERFSVWKVTDHGSRLENFPENHLNLAMDVKTVLRASILAGIRLGIELAKDAVPDEEHVVNFVQSEVSFIAGWNEIRTETLIRLDSLAEEVTKEV